MAHATAGAPSLRGKSAVVVGGGIAGLTAAHALVQRGARVTLLERRLVLGGLARSEPVGGRLREVYYHFICAGDQALLMLLDEVGLREAVEWSPASTSYYVEGRMHPFTTPLDILRFSPLRWRDRLRFGWHAARARRRREGSDLEDLTAEAWLRREVGDRAYQVIWEPLLRSKFGRYASEVSAPWIWHRIHRASASRASLLRPERFGCLTGGTQMLLEALADRVEDAGGKILLGTEATGLAVRNGRVAGVETDAGGVAADLVISAVPLPELAPLLPETVADFRATLDAVDFLGVSCLLVLLRRPLTDQYWINLADPRIPASGIIEYSNLNRHAEPAGGLAYLPLYTPRDDSRYLASPEELTEELVTALRLVIPDLQPTDITGTLLSRDHYAQAVTPPGFAQRIPPRQAPLAGLYLLDSTQLYPSDRCLSGMIALAEGLVESL
jgi:protoporphyrinogen oxidase